MLLLEGWKTEAGGAAGKLAPSEARANLARKRQARRHLDTAALACASIGAAEQISRSTLFAPSAAHANIHVVASALHGRERPSSSPSSSSPPSPAACLVAGVLLAAATVRTARLDECGEPRWRHHPGDLNSLPLFAMPSPPLYRQHLCNECLADAHRPPSPGVHRPIVSLA